MLINVPQILLHANIDGKNDPVNSVDFHPSLSMLASGGSGEKRLLLWTVGSQLDFQAEVANGHQHAVNIVRFSPSGDYLATASDDGTIYVFSPKEGKLWTEVVDADARERGERFLDRVSLIAHTSDVCDLAWSADSRYLASASIDNTVIIWDVAKKAKLETIRDHTHFVQGVAWALGPQQTSCLASLGSDQSLRTYVFNAAGKKKLAVKDKVIRGQPRLFGDDTVPSFSRRLAWSPDGVLLVAPTGQLESKEPEITALGSGSTTTATSSPTKKEVSPVTYVFRAGKMSAPVAALECGSKPSIAVRFHAKPFKLRESVEPWALLKDSAGVQYRFVFAVATLDSVFVYDTQHAHPVACAANLHYASLTDLTWDARPDGSCSLVAASTDGYVSVFTFGPGELGEVETAAAMPEPAKLSGAEEAAPGLAASEPGEGVAESADFAAEVVASEAGAAAATVSAASAPTAVASEFKELRQESNNTAASRRVPLLTSTPPAPSAAFAAAGVALPESSPLAEAPLPRRVSLTPVGMEVNLVTTTPTVHAMQSLAKSAEDDVAPAPSGVVMLAVKRKEDNATTPEGKRARRVPLEGVSQ